MLIPSIATFLVTLINIGLLFIVLRAVLFKPVTKFMEDRTKRVADSIAQAEMDKNQAKKLLEQYEKQLAAAKAEAEGIIKSSRERAREDADRILAEGRAAADRLVANARQQAEAERRAALALFKAEAAALVVAASGRLLKRELTQKDSGRYAAMFLGEAGQD
jgi:F-type H+-transporting ATPase subunit b